MSNKKGEIDGRLEQLFGEFRKSQLEKLADDTRKQSDDFVSLSATVADIEQKNKQKHDYALHILHPEMKSNISDMNEIIKNSDQNVTSLMQRVTSIDDDLKQRIDELEDQMQLSVIRVNSLEETVSTTSNSCTPGRGGPSDSTGTSGGQQMGFGTGSVPSFESSPPRDAGDKLRFGPPPYEAHTGAAHHKPTWDLPAAAPHGPADPSPAPPPPPPRPEQLPQQLFPQLQPQQPQHPHGFVAEGSAPRDTCQTTDVPTCSTTTSTATLPPRIWTTPAAFW